MPVPFVVRMLMTAAVKFSCMFIPRLPVAFMPYVLVIVQLVRWDSLREVRRLGL